MLLYAGKAILTVLNTPSKLDIVKKLIQKSLPAGNTFNQIKSGTSETLRNEVVLSRKKFPLSIDLISEHVPKHVKPLNNEQFGHYLAGVIDGNSHFNQHLQLVIEFDSFGVGLAYYLKKTIGHGSVKKVKDKNTYILVLGSFKAIDKVIKLINNKIRSSNKVDEIRNNLAAFVVKHGKLSNMCFHDLDINHSIDLKNH